MNTLREFLARHRPVVSVGAVLVTLAALAWAFWPKPLPKRVITSQAWFVDEETGEEFVRNMAEVPPLPNPKAPAGPPTLVRAHFYSCDGGQTRQLAYLETYTPEGKAALTRLRAIRDRPPPDELLDAVLKGTRVRRPGKGQPWVAGDDPVALEIANTFPCPPGRQPKVVLPPKGEAVELK